MENTFGNALTISVVGFGLVFTCLAFFAIMIAFLNSTDRRITAYKKKKAEMLSSVPKTITGDDIDEEIVPVIVAAAYSAFGKQIVVRKITFANATNSESDWSRISRASSVSTHNIRRRG